MRSSTEATQVLAELLNAERDFFNTRFAVAQSRRRSLSPREWRTVLREDVAPLILAVHQVLPERADAAARAAYECALELLARNDLGPRAPGSMARLWREVLPLVPRVVAAEPRRVLSHASNALLELRAHHLEGPWLQRLQDLAASEVLAGGDAEEFERSLFVLAWRCGLAHARAGALASLRAMPSERGRALLDVAEEESAWPALLERLGREPFFDPCGASDALTTLKVVAQVGDWEAWGGTMAQPPRVTRRRGAIWAWSGRSWWRLHADAFGATLTPARFHTPPEQMPPLQGNDESGGAWKLQAHKPPAQGPAASAVKGAPGVSSPALQVAHGPNASYREARTALLSGFDGVLSAASDDHLLAFTSPLSLRILVVARA